MVKKVVRVGYEFEAGYLIDVSDRPYEGSGGSVGDKFICRLDADLRKEFGSRVLWGRSVRDGILGGGLTDGGMPEGHAWVPVEVRTAPLRFDKGVDLGCRVASWLKEVRGAVPDGGCSAHTNLSYGDVRQMDDFEDLLRDKFMGSEVIGTTLKEVDRRYGHQGAGLHDLVNLGWGHPTKLIRLFGRGSMGYYGSTSFAKVMAFSDIPDGLPAVQRDFKIKQQILSSSFGAAIKLKNGRWEFRVPGGVWYMDDGGARLKVGSEICKKFFERCVLEPDWLVQRAERNLVRLARFIEANRKLKVYAPLYVRGGVVEGKKFTVGGLVSEAGRFSGRGLDWKDDLIGRSA